MLDADLTGGFMPLKLGIRFSTTAQNWQNYYQILGSNCLD